jgi:hypothetical protein
MSRADAREVERKIANGSIEVAVDGNQVIVTELRPLKAGGRTTIANAYPGHTVIFIKLPLETNTLEPDAEERRADAD